VIHRKAKASIGWLEQGSEPAVYAPLEGACGTFCISTGQRKRTSTNWTAQDGYHYSICYNVVKYSWVLSPFDYQKQEQKLTLCLWWHMLYIQAIVVTQWCTIT